MGKRYRMAIVGVGAMAGVYARAIRSLENAELVAGSCRTEAKGKNFAQEFECQWYEDYERMLDEAKPDVAVVVTPSGYHLEPILACAKRGVNVACTKPLEITTERCDQVIEAAREAGIMLAGLFPTRFTEVAQVVHEAVSGGRFGQPAVINSYTPWWRDDAYYSPDRWQGTAALDGGGAVMNQSIHGVDAMQWLAGAAMPDLPREANPVEQVFAFTGKLGHDPELIEVEDTAVAAVRFRNGTLGQLLCTTSMWPGAYKRLQISGRDGTASILEDELEMFHFRHARPEDEQTLERLSGQTSGGGASDPMAINFEHEARQFEAILGALDGSKMPPIDGVEARKAVAIVEAVYESARTGEAVRPK